MMMLRHLGAILRILGHQNGAFFPLVGSLQEDRCDAVRWEEFYSNVLLLALLHSELVLPWFQMMHCSKFSQHQCWSLIRIFVILTCPGISCLFLVLDCVLLGWFVCWTDPSWLGIPPHGLTSRPQLVWSPLRVGLPIISCDCPIELSKARLPY